MPINPLLFIYIQLAALQGSERVMSMPGLGERMAAQHVDTGISDRLCLSTNTWSLGIAGSPGTQWLPPHPGPLTPVATGLWVVVDLGREVVYQIQFTGESMLRIIWVTRIDSISISLLSLEAACPVVVQ